MFESREKAQRAILAGTITVDGRTADKPGTKFATDSRIEGRQAERYVGRGGLKLEAALEAFAIDVTGATCLDIGASTGGFTDCLLQHAARKVYAFDVGHGQLAWKIRSDSRVVVREKFNARYLEPGDLPEPVDVCVIDVSFISLELILPPAARGIESGGEPDRCRTIVMLIKPQFELGREEVGRGGIVRDPAGHGRAVEKIRDFVARALPSWRWTGVVDSPILGTEGNHEFLACLRK
jgi:23S rRNA (cytidine1920-2'-O)/16S rRNA (cytidine1409-2'-O)-methyltransferase